MFLLLNFMKYYKKLERPIIFIGTGRSGTTIISEIIHRHPDLAFPSTYQNHYPDQPKVNYIRNLFDNSFWRIMGQKPQLNKISIYNKYIFKLSEAYEMWDYLTGDTIDFSRGFLIDEELSESRIDFIRSYFNKMVLYQNRKRLSFKITGPSRISFLLKIFPDAIFINLRRNLIPTISSFVKIGFWQSRGIDKLWWTGVYNEKELNWVTNNSDNPALLAAFQLKKINEILAEERLRCNPVIMDVNYEDFVINPKKELDKIVDFTGLPLFDIDKHLKKINIYNRNKTDKEYFSKQDLQKIYELI